MYPYPHLSLPLSVSVTESVWEPSHMPVPLCQRLSETRRASNAVFAQWTHSVSAAPTHHIPINILRVKTDLKNIFDIHNQYTDIHNQYMYKIRIYILLWYFKIKLNVVLNFINMTESLFRICECGFETEECKSCRAAMLKHFTDMHSRREYNYIYM